MSQHETEAAKRERLRKQLDDTHAWPCEFTFKFIVSSHEGGEAALKAIFRNRRNSVLVLPAMDGTRRLPLRIG